MRRAGLRKFDSERWQTQAWLLNLADYVDIEDVKDEIMKLRIPARRKRDAVKLAKVVVR